MDISLNPSRTFRDPRILGLPEAWFHLALGLALAPIFAWVPFVSLVGWFFQAIVHEMGHTAASWLVGVPAVPALGITAEAATLHGEQILPLALAIWAGGVWLTMRRTENASRVVLLVVLATLFPALCLTGLREGWVLIGGHLAELVVAGLFLARAISGGFTQSAVERSMYAALSWFLLGHNTNLTLGLMTSSSARDAYSGNGSFGLQNDYSSLAEWAGTSVEAVALPMTVLAVCIAPAVLGLWSFARTRAEG